MGRFKITTSKFNPSFSGNFIKSTHTNKMTKRPNEITDYFYEVLDKHLQDIVSGKADNYLEIQEIADILHIHPTHLSNTIKETTGKSPCDICNEKTIDLAKQLLKNPDMTVSEVAITLTYEPTNFTKYFKKHTGLTPSQYKQSLLVAAD